MCCHDDSFFFHNQTQDFDNKSIVISEEKESKEKCEATSFFNQGQLQQQTVQMMSMMACLHRSLVPRISQCWAVGNWHVCSPMRRRLQTVQYILLMFGVFGMFGCCSARGYGRDPRIWGLEFGTSDVTALWASDVVLGFGGVLVPMDGWGEVLGIGDQV